MSTFQDAASDKDVHVGVATHELSSDPGPVPPERKMTVGQIVKSLGSREAWFGDYVSLALYHRREGSCNLDRRVLTQTRSELCFSLHSQHSRFDPPT